MPALRTLSELTFEGGETYGDRAHFVHLYVVEPHPAGDLSPYRGEVWEAEYSDRGQAMTYDERVADARDVEGLLGEDQMLLVDDLTPRPLDNPAWCTYGPCPNCAYLIAQGGTIHTAQTWVEPSDMQRALDDVLGR